MFLWALVRAPARQRDEARAQLADLSSAALTVTPHVSTKRDQVARDVRSLASVRVANTQKGGGQAANAQQVGVEVTVLDDGREVHGSKSWSSGASLDITTAGEEHSLWIAAKWQSQSECHALNGDPDDTGPSLGEGSFEVRVELWGNNVEPSEHTFLLTNPGAGQDLAFEKN